MAINNRKLLLLCNPGFPGRNHVSCVPNVLQRYKDYFMSPVGGAWIDGEYGEIIEEPQGMSVGQELTWLTGILGEINRNADYAMIVFVGHGDSYQGQDRLQLSRGGIVHVSDFLPLQGQEDIKRRTVIIDACRSLQGGTPRQLILEQREYSGQGQIESDPCRTFYNELVENCEPHTELIQSTSYGNVARVNQTRTGTAFSDAFFNALDVSNWNNQALGVRDGRLHKSTIDILPQITAGMQSYGQVPQQSRLGKGNGDYPIYAVWRPVERRI